MHSKKEGGEQLMIFEKTLNRITHRIGKSTWESARTLRVFEKNWYEDPARQKVYDIIAGISAPGTTLLDGGCGIGFDAERILTRCNGIKYTGVDNSRKMIERCESKFRLRYPSAVFLQGDISKLPFPDASFDVVISCNVIVHISNFVACLTDLCRVCRSHLVLQLNYIDEKGAYLGGLSPSEFDAKFLDKKSMMYFVYYNPQEITDMCAAMGLERTFKKNFWLEKYKREATVLQFDRRTG
jgi:ubiquinone/menaquinone biosynthesis C-methylase UbiE